MQPAAQHDGRGLCAGGLIAAEALVGGWQMLIFSKPPTEATGERLPAVNRMARRVLHNRVVLHAGRGALAPPPRLAVPQLGLLRMLESTERGQWLVRPRFLSEGFW